MENRSYALVTGLFILLLCAAAVAGGIWLSGSTEEKLPYVVTSTDSVSGLVTHSLVLYRGVQVGQVDSIKFDPQNFQHIDIHISIDADVPVTKDTFAVLRAQGVTGLSRLELDNSGKQRQRVATRVGDPAVIPMHQSLLDKVTNSGADLLAGGKQLLQHFNDLLNADNRQRIGKTLDNLQQATAQLVTLESALSPSLRQVPAVATQMQKTLRHINQVLEQLGQLVTSAKQLGKAGAQAGATLSRTTLPQINQLIKTLNGTAENLQDLAGKLNQHPESLLRGEPARAPGPGEPGYEGPSQ